ncbi:MAG: trigger factor [Phycisphaerae bacterium]|nr:trigger factor [Phycisphaerae bacterium]MDD5380383.1 trigger factor [Phycisphaerae bacterium]
MAKEQETTELKNTVKIENAGPCKKKITIEIPEETVKKTTDEQYETLRKEITLPGFRKGRAPRRLLEKRFGKETTEQIKLKLLADASESALKDNKLDILREPDIDFKKVELPATGPLKFDFEVEVRPEFDLPKLDGIPVEKQKLKVTDEQIETEIEQLQKWSGIWTPRDGGKVELNDQIIADVVLKTEGVEEEQKLNNTEIYVRPSGFVGAIPVEKLDELLVGAKTGDTKKTSVEVPKTYFQQEYRGKKVDVQIAVKEAKWLKPAAMDENFFQRVGVKDETELRDKLRASLQARLEQQVRGEMAEQIYKYMLDNTKLDLPVDVVAEQSNALLQKQYSNLMMRGIGREQIEEHMEQLRAGSEQQANEQLKTLFIMAKVAEKFEIEVTDEEINGHIAQMAVQRGQRPERMREEMNRDGSLAQFKLQVREDKCIAKLLESARITEIEPRKVTKKAEKPAKAEKAAKPAKTTAEEKPAKTVAKKQAKKPAPKAHAPEKKPAQKHKTTTQKSKPKGKKNR